ncbi:MAG: hypothetical protein AVDCRST_MAG17-2242 [uncultured Solirubrobacterales bacterium]|uniref:Uncharacterized protein n=1 Tax=uncultured Solirubrobacterales bacterium TaxID=768556 RepID=A0A6J4T7F4_9ACTN|nr:MAG: hypothetical protein AVDCRST_MAG17-2242 [uncultured Solirubrobacterales bacterium]
MAFVNVRVVAGVTERQRLVEGDRRSRDRARQADSRRLT